MHTEVSAQPIDVHHLGRRHVICCWRLGDVLVDPGPASTVPALLDALGDVTPRALLLTHVHLDHAGGSGTLVRHFPELEVYVHELGAPHLADPAKLLTSARRLYGEDMDRLWGEILPVPRANLRPLRGGEQVEGLEVAYTPGHASHHVAYFDPGQRRAYVGDVAGVRIPPSDFVVAPTPPPDIDLEAWRASVQRVEAWQPASLGLTHFGEVADVPAQLAGVRDRLERWGELARSADADAFAQAVRDEIRTAAGPELADAYEQAAPADQLYLGLERYWRRRREG